MRNVTHFCIFLFVAFCSAVGLAAAPPPQALRPGPATPTAGAEAADYFEKHVRPVLVEQCGTCHGATVQQAGLRLDRPGGLRKPAASGRTPVVPGHPERSALIEAIRFTGKLKMPPAGKLPDPVIDALTAWVKMGAPWPEASRPAVAGGQPAAGHWAFQPVRPPAVPKVKNAAWVRTPVDAFVLAKLEEAGIAPAGPADRRTLIRRATYDLTGLPPTAEEIDAFEKDTAPKAWEKVVDRLLASPHYGERWGRYWLDVARYADTKGYVFQEDRNYPFAYTYRDWVIRSLNEDLPYDQFLIQQIAADHLALGADKRPLAALGFLTLGRRFLNNQPDIIDDRIDVVTRGTMALTVQCARCHDHKYDPIPTADYYSLYGVFASSTEPDDLPLIGEPQQGEAYAAYKNELDRLQGDLRKFLDQQRAKVLPEARRRVADYLLAERELQGQGMQERVRAIARSRDLNGVLLGRWHEILQASRQGHNPVFAPWNALATLPDAEFAAKAPALAARFTANAEARVRLNPPVAGLFAGAPPQNLKEVAERYQRLLVQIDDTWQETLRAVPAGKEPPETLPDPDQESLRLLLYGMEAPANVPEDQFPRLLDREARNQLQGFQQKVDRFRATSAAAPPHAMVLVDSPRLVSPRVFLRGNAGNLGPEVPRQFLGVVAGPNRKPFAKGSGRLELAQAIANEENPLTARVMVNRAWLYHFGQPLVRTPGDFGLRSDPPTHPELLDWLAVAFRDGELVGSRVGGNPAPRAPTHQLTGVPRPATGPRAWGSPTRSRPWSLKALHRLIMLSNAYQMTSDGDARAARRDPENRLLSRTNRRRLDLEALRDSLLAVSGQLDRTVGGRSVEITRAPYSRRRTVYGFIDRQNLQGLYRTFDFASPDTTSPQRYSTTVPQQALFMMNSPFVQEQARHLVKRGEVAGKNEPTERVQALYRLVYGRLPEPEELRMGIDYVQAGSTSVSSTQGPTGGLTPWEKYAQALLLSNEFAFVD